MRIFKINSVKFISILIIIGSLITGSVYGYHQYQNLHSNRITVNWSNS